MRISTRTGLLACAFVAWTAPAFAGTDAESCVAPYLAPEYSDCNGDLIADPPTDPALWRNPSTLVWAYAPIEDPAVYAELFKPFTTHLKECLGRQIVYYPVMTGSAEIEALKSGRLHFAGFATGSTVTAVREAGAVPFATKGVDGAVRGYRLIAVVRADSPYHTLSALAGKRVAHSSPLSNSGNIAPRVLFPEQGLRPDADYEPIMSGGHDRSLLGLVAGDYDMAAVASDVYERMVERGMIDPDALRIIYESPLFPTSSFVYAHDLDPVLSQALERCFFDFEFPTARNAGRIQWRHQFRSAVLQG